MTAAVLLSALLARLPASAQDTSAPAADAAVEAPSEAAAVLSAPPPPGTASAEPAPAPHQPVALGATDVAWQELRAMQLRHDEILRQRDSNVALPAVGMAVGLAAFGIMLPFGSMLVADANTYGDDEYAQHDRAVGGTLIAFGILGFAAFVAGSVAVALKRKRRTNQDSEMKSLADRRTLLENLLEADWRTRQAPRAP